MSFTPHDLTREIQKVLPDLKVTYNVDPLRQAIGEITRRMNERYSCALKQCYYNTASSPSPLSGRLANGVGGQRSEAGLGLEARV